MIADDYRLKLKLAESKDTIEEEDNLKIWGIIRVTPARGKV